MLSRKCSKPLKAGARVIAELSEAYKAVEEVNKLKGRLEGMERKLDKVLFFVEKVIGAKTIRQLMEAKNLLDLAAKTGFGEAKTVDLG